MALADKVTINVGGTIYITRWSTLQKPNCSRLSKLSTSDRDFDSAKHEFYFDRNGAHFDSILDVHRTGTLHIPHNVCIPRILEEMKYWEVPLENVACCCWARIRQFEQTVEQIHQLNNCYTVENLEGIGGKRDDQNIMTKVPGANKFNDSPNKKISGMRRLANSIWMLLEQPRSSRCGLVHTLNQ